MSKSVKANTNKKKKKKSVHINTYLKFFSTSWFMFSIKIQIYFLFVDNLGNDEVNKFPVISHLKLILTFYCKNQSLQYESNNGWIELLPKCTKLQVSKDVSSIFWPKRKKEHTIIVESTETTNDKR